MHPVLASALPEAAAVGEATVQLAVRSLIDAAHARSWMARAEGNEDPRKCPLLRPRES